MMCVKAENSMVTKAYQNKHYQQQISSFHTSKTTRSALSAKQIHTQAKASY
jgi:hypothetical protein